MAKKATKKQKPLNPQKVGSSGIKTENLPEPEPDLHFPPDASFIEKAKIYFQKFFLIEFIWLVFYFFLLLPFDLVHKFVSSRSPLGDLEESWQYSINMAIERHLTFGRDFIFTYGPLGFLQTKFTIGISKWMILLPELFLVACSIFALRYILQRSGRNILCTISIALFLILLKGINTLNLFVPLFLFYLFYFFNHRKLWSLHLATILAVFVFFVKVNWGIVLLFFLYLALALSVYKKFVSKKDFGVIGAVHIGLTILLAFVLRVDLIQYIQSSIHLISGYNEGMFIPIPFTDMHFLLAMPVLALYTVGFIAGFKRYMSDFLLLCLWVFSGMWLFVIFKYGFVRTDWHLSTFFMTCSTPFGIMYAFEKGLFKRIWGWLSVAVMIISFSALALTNKFNSNILDRPVLSNLSPDYIKDIFSDVSYKEKMPVDRATPFIIPKDYQKYIGKSTIDIMPTEISEIFYDKLNYDPRPVIQSYSAYDLFLDTKNHEKYTSPSRPEYVLFSLATIDARYAFWDESITKTALLTDYELITKNKGNMCFDEKFYLQEYPKAKAAIDSGHFRSAYDHYSRLGISLGFQTCFDEKFYTSLYPDVDSAIKAGAVQNAYEHYIRVGRKEQRQTSYTGQDSAMLLFKSRSKPLKLDVLGEKQISVQLGEEYKIDHDDNLQFLYANVEYDLWGKLSSFFYQPPQLVIGLRHADGQLVYCAGIIPILKTGVLLNRKVDNCDEARALFSGRPDRASDITGIIFYASPGFKPEIKATIREIKYPLSGQ